MSRTHSYYSILNAFVEALKLRTISSLVETISMARGGVNTDVKLLFLKDDQARDLKIRDVDHLCSVMDIPQRPNLVITLVSSYARIVRGGPWENHWSLDRESDNTFCPHKHGVTDVYVAEVGGEEGLAATATAITSG